MLKIIVQFLAWVFGGGGTTSGSSTEKGMNEGEMHSGPHGYSPNTAYSDTEYGKHDWEAEEH